MKRIEYLIVFLIILFKVLLFSAGIPYLITILVYGQYNTTYWNQDTWDFFKFLQIIFITVIAILIIYHGFKKSSSSEENS